MERKVIFCPKWFLLLTMLCLFHVTKAEITCRSCQPGNKFRPQELMLKIDVSRSATGSEREVFGNGNGAERSSVGTQRLGCAGGSAECAHNGAEYTQPRLKRNTPKVRSEDQTPGGESDFERPKIKVPGVKTSGRREKAHPGLFTSTVRFGKRTRRSSGDRDGVGEAMSPGLAQSQDPGEDITVAAAGRRVTRSELRWSGEERRATGPRQEELKMNSSTFALTGDSSHNQAMVHWSGQNSSVSHLTMCTLSITDWTNPHTHCGSAVRWAYRSFSRVCACGRVCVWERVQCKAREHTHPRASYSISPEPATLSFSCKT